MEEKDFIGKIFHQNCGDDLLVLKKEGNKYIGIFQKYLFEIIAEKANIIKGKIYNPQIDIIEFEQKIWLQNCGDSLKIIRKTNEYQNSAVFYEVEFINVFYKTKALKANIKRGSVLNPLLEDFIGKKIKQNCGDILEVIEKTTKKQNREGGNYLYLCKFINHPCEVLSTKGHILEKCVDNPQIEKDNFIGKIFPQKGGDSVKILRKTNKHLEGRQEFLFEVEYQKYPYKLLAEKQNIIYGRLFNPNLPWRNKETLLKILKLFGRKVTLQELSKSLGCSLSHIGHKINEFNLRTYISYYENYGEASLREFIAQFIEVYPEEYYISDKEGKYYGIDVYIPSKKIGFEFNGTYWHSELFKNSQYHQKKSLIAKEQEIQLFHIWEHEWNDSIKRSIIESLIKSKLGIFKNKIGASKCKVVDLTYKKYSNFCNDNHIQGEAGAKVKLGLTYKDKLIQTMSFGVPRFTDSIEWEIIRECSKCDYIIMGGKEKLWKYFIKNYNPKSVISYCDYSKFNGNSYLKLNFEKIRLNKPGFVWYDEKSRNVYWRNPYQHQKMKDKYIKVFDAGQLVFVWQSSK